jgi:hypothetical protein
VFGNYKLEQMSVTMRSIARYSWVYWFLLGDFSLTVGSESRLPNTFNNKVILVMFVPYFTQLTQVSPVAVVRFVNGISAGQFGSPAVQLTLPE